MSYCKIKLEKDYAKFKKAWNNGKNLDLKGVKSELRKLNEEMKETKLTLVPLLKND